MQSASAPVAAAEKIAPSLFSLAFTNMYDWWLGKKYSKRNREHLETLKKIYSKHFKGAALPDNFFLDGNNRPLHYHQTNDFSTYALPGPDDRSSRNFPYSSDNMQGALQHYLTVRRNRTFGGGAEGDLLEQFLGEWLTWSTHSLPGMLYADPITIPTLQKRLNYINDIISNLYLFNYSALPTRKNNKNACFEMIKESLEQAIKLAEQEKQRSAARELLELTRTSISRILTKCLNMVFFTRKSETNCKNLDIVNFLNNKHPEIRKTYTGAMLHEVIRMAGTQTFTLLNTEMPTDHAYEFFNDQNTPQKIDWTEDYSDDSPVWVTDEKQKRLFVVSVQNLCAAMLRFAEVKALVEEAYDLAGSGGNLWAYANKEGKKALQGLIFLHDTEIANLYTTVQAFYDKQVTARTTHMKLNKNKEKNNSNLNFNNVIETWPDVSKLFEQLKQTMAELDKQQKNFPENGEELISEQQQKFYRHTNHIFRTAYPKIADQYLLDTQASALEIYAPDESFRNKVLFIASRFKLPFNGNTLYKAAEYAGFHNEIPAIENINNIPEPWELGNDYQDWAENFFTRHRKQFAEFTATENAYHEAILKVSSDDIVRLGEQMKGIIKAIEIIVKAEEPKWRFKYLIWPVTAGYPFNRSAHRFANLLIADLTKQYDDIRAHESKAYEYINNPALTTTSTGQAHELMREGHRNYHVSINTTADSPSSRSSAIPQTPVSTSRTTTRTASNVRFHQTTPGDQPVTPPAGAQQTNHSPRAAM